MVDFSRGSEWRKWDLHIHTPFSICQDYGGENKFDEFIQSLEKLPQDVKVIGINDYYFIDGFEKVIEAKFNGKINNIEKLFPVIEFRTDIFGSNNENKLCKVNLHIIFNLDENNIKKEIKMIKEEFLTKIILKNKNNEKHLGQGKQAFIDLADNLESGFNDIIPNTIQILSECAAPKWKNKTFILLGYTEWNNINKNNQIKPIKEELAAKVNAFFTAGNDKYKDKEVIIRQFTSSAPLLHSKDIHNFDALTKNYICNTWIKADPTFEGLKQIIYEPTERVKIQVEKPISPFRKISKISLNFTDDIKIKDADKEREDKLCFAGVKKEINLSDFFTTFIGGRGTGKSTLLNLIFKAFSEGNNTEFFKKNKLIRDGKDIKVSDLLIIETTADKIEFFEQNQIEEFATNPISFSKSIQDRLRNKEILEKENFLKVSLNKFDIQIKNINDQINIESQLFETKKNYEAAIKLIDTFNNDSYNIIIKEITSFNKEYMQIKSDRDKIDNLRKEINLFLGKNEKYTLASDATDYLKTYNKFLDDLDNLVIEVLDEDIFIKLKEKEDALYKNIESKKSELEKYLNDKGLTEENMQDVKSSATKAEEYNVELDKLEKDLKSLKEKLNSFTTEEIIKLNRDYEELIKKRIDEFKNILDEVNKENPEDIDKIELSYNFNKDFAKNKIFNDFFEMFSSYKNNYQFGKPDVKECLFKASLDDIINNKLNFEDFFKKIKGTNQYNRFLQDVFKNELNFEIYKLIVKKHLYNNYEYLKIDISYRGKPINQASFGQKCTAAIVIMLLFGNNPIIIDEPEAHLDSSLIANYLVKLIMKQKNNRQIIFATHNANFVINADSEQIYILEMPDSQTQFTQTSIENIENRDKLLKLEGGKIAFEKRENKYGIKRN